MLLVPFTPSHFSILPGWFPDQSAVVQWGGSLLDFPLDAPQMQTMLDDGKTDPPRRLCWMTQENREWVGHVQLAFDWKNGNATLGRVAVNPEFRGKGLAVPMIEQVIRVAFDFPPIERLELSVYTFNTQAIRTYTQLGFTPEGIRRSSTRVGSLRWDTATMAILRSEFESMKSGE